MKKASTGQHGPSFWKSCVFSIGFSGLDLTLSARLTAVVSVN
jgi:hypothetical protein